MKKIVFIFSFLSAVLIAHAANGTDSMMQSVAADSFVVAGNVATREIPKCVISYSNLNGGKLYCNGEHIPTSQFRRLAMAADSTVWQQYLKGGRMRTAGTVLMGLGAPAFAAGVVLLAFSVNTDGSIGDLPMALAGSFMTVAGGGMIAAGVPVYVVGVSKRRKAVERYNSLNSADNGASALSLSFGITQSGALGLSLNF